MYTQVTTHLSSTPPFRRKITILDIPPMREEYSMRMIGQGHMKVRGQQSEVDIEMTWTMMKVILGLREG